MDTIFFQTAKYKHSSTKDTYLREICAERFFRASRATKDTEGSYLWVVDGDEAVDEARQGHHRAGKARAGVREVTRRDAPGAPPRDSPPGSAGPLLNSRPGPAAACDIRSGRSADSLDRGRVNRIKSSAARQPRRRQSRRWAAARGSWG